MRNGSPTFGFDLSAPLVFSFLDTFRDEYQGNKSDIADFFSFWSILKVTIDMNSNS